MREKPNPKPEICATVGNAEIDYPIFVTNGIWNFIVK